MNSSSSEKYLQLLREAQTVRPEKLPDDFPYAEFQRNLSKYNENDRWYDGTALDDEITIEGTSVKKYPVRINPIKGTCGRHVAMLFGDISDGDQVLVTPRAVRKPDSTPEQKKLQDEVEEMLMQVWYDSNGRDIQFNNGMSSQRYGGCVFYVKYDPFAPKQFPITVDAPTPKFFIGVPNSSNPYELEEAWIIKPISSVELKNQAITPLPGFLGIIRGFSEDDVHWIVEHYTKLICETFVDGVKVGREVIMPSAKKEIIPIGGNNAIHMVPIVYIPHIRNSANFYGDNVFDNVRGLVLEMNARVADYGDAVSMDSHNIVVTKNTNAVTVNQLIPGVTRVDIGSGISVTGQEAQPDATLLKTSGLASTAMKELVNDILYKQYRRDAIHPAVCDGEDEGSQRSSQTLTTRMWALETHALQERTEWTAGLNMLAKIIIRMLATYAPEKGITEEHLAVRLRQVWFPTLKKDREQLVTEIATRVGAKITSVEHAIDMLGDVEDVEDEMKKVIEFWKKIGEIEAQQNQLFGGGKTTPSDTKSKPTTQVKKGES